MKKYLLLFIIAVFAMSCSKKVEVKGKIAGSSPLERIEFVEASGVATLPLINIGLDKDGNFTGNFEAPKDGMYVMNYAGKSNLIFLKGGQNIQISGNSATFPNEYTLTGDGKADNEFYQACQKFLMNYAQTLDIQALTNEKLPFFLKEIKKIETDLNKNVEENIKKFNPSKEMIEWKKNDVNTAILNVMVGFEMLQKQMNLSNPSFKMAKEFTDYENKLLENKEEMVKSSPFFRQYLLTKISPDFQKFAEAKAKGKTDVVTSELFNDFLKTKKDMSQITKDYLLAFVVAQSDMRLGTNPKTSAKVSEIIEKDIKDAGIKEDLKKMQFAMQGPKIGEKAPEVNLVKQDGSSFKLSENGGKPTLVVFYASWNPYVSESTLPVLKEVVNFYKSKMNFVYVNLDDTKDQFVKTSNAMFKGVTGTSVYGEGGLNSDVAKKFGIYGFKTPSFILIDKTGKIATRAYMNLGEQELVSAFDKQTGLSAPTVAPQGMQPQMLTPEQMKEMAPPPPPPAPAK